MLSNILLHSWLISYFYSVVLTLVVSCGYNNIPSKPSMLVLTLFAASLLRTHAFTATRPILNHPLKAFQVLLPPSYLNILSYLARMTGNQ